MRRLLAVVCALLFAGASAPASAREHLTGIVLMAPSGNTVMIHHEAFSGMPAMTMEFTLPPGTTLVPGDHIAADVDRSGEPWKLSALRITAGPNAMHLNLPHFVNVGDSVPDIPLVDQSGRHETLAALHGKPYALTFIYTRCQDPRMCPFVSAKIHAMQTQTPGSPAQFVEISLDPAYDRPAVLTRYAAQYRADARRWHLFTGDPKTVLDFAARFRILERSAGPATILHTERLALVDRNGKITQLIDNPTWQPAAIESALASL